VLAKSKQKWIVRCVVFDDIDDDGRMIAVAVMMRDLLLLAGKDKVWQMIESVSNPVVRLTARHIYYQQLATMN